MILDADILIDLKRKHPSALAWFASLTDPVPASGLAALELLQVCVTRQEHRQLKAFLRDFAPSVWRMASACWTP